jgi:hypothetical protein
MELKSNIEDYKFFIKKVDDDFETMHRWLNDIREGIRKYPPAQQISFYAFLQNLIMEMHIDAKQASESNERDIPGIEAIRAGHDEMKELADKHMVDLQQKVGEAMSCYAEYKDLVEKAKASK